MRLCAAAVALMLPLPAVAADYLGKVTSVADGDTLHDGIGDRQVRVRICGIDVRNAVSRATGRPPAFWRT